jgi:cysteine-rich repeat protein
MITSDECPACQAAFCGDGYVEAGVEFCDDGNQNSNDACTHPFCEPNICGDGITYDGMEDCDDANDVDGDACTNGCTTAVCGDGVIHQGVEECDDGNDIEDDGCDSMCIASADPQCFLPYTEFTDPNRNVNLQNGPVYCDQQNGNGWVGPGWYRFTGQAGTQMPESAPATYRCATHATGWLNGVHPTLADGVVARQACFNWSGNTCSWNANIQVVACPGYYLYNLVAPPACSLRYCGEN